MPQSRFCIFYKTHLPEMCTRGGSCRSGHFNNALEFARSQCNYCSLAPPSEIPLPTFSCAICNTKIQRYGPCSRCGAMQCFDCRVPTRENLCQRCEQPPTHLSRSPTQHRSSDQLKGNDEATDDPSLACVICITNVKCCVMQPCAHLCLCLECARGLQKRDCPLCRAPIQYMQRIFQ